MDKYNDYETEEVGITDEMIMAKVTELMTRLKQNQELQKMSEENGIDMKNSVKLTERSMENIAVSVISLLLAKRSGDKAYASLVECGIEHRTKKTDLVDKYKDEALSFLNKYNLKQSS